MGWEKVRKYKECGGIGVTDLEVKNKALLNKWIWQYGEEKDSLWREILVGTTGSDLIVLLSNVSVNRRVST